MQIRMFERWLAVLGFATFTLCVATFAQAQDSKPRLDVGNRELVSAISNLGDTGLVTSVRPNELEIQYLQDIAHDAPPGVYLTVGTERGFIATAANPQFTETFFVDRDSEVVLYNRLNIELLRISENHADYIWLRSAATIDEILERRKSDLKSRGAYDPTQEGVMRASYRRFHVLLRSTLFNSDLLAAPNSVFSQDVNYVTNPVLCERLISLAKAGKLSAHRLDLTDIEAVTAFRNRRLANRRISAIDASNAWWDNFAGLKSIRRLLQALQPTAKESYGHASPLVILTDAHSKRGHWYYMAFPITAAANNADWFEITETLGQLTKTRHAGTSYDVVPSIVANIEAHRARSPIFFSRNAARSCELLFKNND